MSTGLLVVVSAQLQLSLIAMRANRFTRCLTLLRRSTSRFTRTAEKFVARELGASSVWMSSTPTV